MYLMTERVKNVIKLVNIAYQKTFAQPALITIFLYREETVSIQTY